MESIAFIGLGNMGGPMAANLLRAGHTVRGFDLVPAALEAARQHGVQIASSAADAARDADVVITMLPAGRHVVDLYERELIGAARGGTLFLDCSTIDVPSSRRAHEMGAHAGMMTVDAPVSGGVTGAANATLTFMMGGDDAAVERARPVLEKMGKRLVHCGAAGTGQIAKICNNLILGISMIGVSEAFVLGERLGISSQALFDVVSTASGQCWSVTSYCPVPGPVPASPANRDYQPGFMAELMLKDLKLACNEADLLGLQLPLGEHAEAYYEQFVSGGSGKLDFSGIIKQVRSEESK